MRLLLGIAALALATGCRPARPAETAVEKAWVRLPAVPGNPGAAYFTIRGGSAPATLLKVSAPFATRTELHESIKGHEGMMSMAPLRQVAVPAGAAVGFAPGGKHVMLFDIGPGVQPGTRVPLGLAFADGRTIETEARVVGAGDPAPE
ncbi:MAG: copper chaperone PCu(A)C [Sphingomonas sp.]